MSELRKLSEFCKYGESLDDTLCDRLVCGLAERRVQQRFLAEGDLTFDKAMKIAQAMELAERDARDLQHAGAHSNVPVHKLAQPQGASKQDKGKKRATNVEGVMTPLSAASVMQSAMHAGRRATSRGHAEARPRCSSQTKVNKPADSQFT